MADPVVTFDAPTPAGVTVTGGTVMPGSAPLVTTAPNGTAYLAVKAGETATVSTTTGYQGISFDWGSPDYFNAVTIFDTVGNVLARFTGNDTGWLGLITKPFSYSVAPGSTTGIGSLQFTSTLNAFEIDNIAFNTPITSSTQVPEPSMMLMFAAATATLVARRRRAAKR